MLRENVLMRQAHWVHIKSHTKNNERGCVFDSYYLAVCHSETIVLKEGDGSETGHTAMRKQKKIKTHEQLMEKLIYPPARLSPPLFTVAVTPTTLPINVYRNIVLSRW